MRLHVFALTTLSTLALAAIGCSADSGGGLSGLHGSGSSRGGTSDTGSGTGTGTGAGAGSGTGTGAGTGSGTGTTSPSGPSSTVGSETWADGKALASSVTIAAGATVTIAPGAAIKVANGVTITVLGTLTAASSSAHAKLTGTGWTGIVVGKGGTLSLDGVDVTGAATGVETLTGATAASLANGSIVGASTPFKVGTATTFSLSHAKVVAEGQSAVNGKLVASYLDYDKQGNEGIVTGDPTAEMSIEDSTLHGSGGGDFVVSQAGKHVHVAYTTIGGAHCGFHFDAVDAFDIDHVTDNSNSYGAMLYGSGAGPNSIKASSFTNTQHDLDAQGTNGPLTIDGSYTSGKDSYVGVKPTVTNSATAPVASAKPR